jgi:hypothetical protein
MQNSPLFDYILLQYLEYIKNLQNMMLCRFFVIAVKFCS